MRVAETQIRTDGPVPISVIHEKGGVRRMTWKQGELEAYVLKHPNVLVEVRDCEGKFVRYMDTQITRNLLKDAGFLPLDIQSQ
jgi:hypothetical protein